MVVGLLGWWSVDSTTVTNFGRVLVFLGLGIAAACAGLAYTSRTSRLRASRRARYGVAGYATGAMGVLGPQRMAYGRAISTVRFVAGLMSDMMYEIYSE